MKSLLFILAAPGSRATRRGARRAVALLPRELPAGNLAWRQGWGQVDQLGSNRGFFRRELFRIEIRDLNDLLCMLRLRWQPWLGRVLQGRERGAKQVSKVVIARGRHPGDNSSVYSELACSHRPQIRLSAHFLTGRAANSSKQDWSTLRTWQGAA